MKTRTQKMFSTGICLIVVAVLSLPGTGHAGWFSDSKPLKKVTQTVKAAPKKVTQTVKAAPGNIQDKVEDISSRINEISDQLRESRPLMDMMKNGHLMGQLTEVVQFLNESQQDYYDFAGDGEFVMRDDIDRLLRSVGNLINALGMEGKMGDQLQKASGLVDKIPTTFLYPLFKAGIGAKITEIRDRFEVLVDDVTLIATLPQEEDVYLYPESYKAELCPLVKDDQTKLQLAVLEAKLEAATWQNKTITGYMPEDLTVSLTVVGGGGATVAKFPGQYIFKIIDTVIGSIQLRLKNYKSIADTMCQA